MKTHVCDLRRFECPLRGRNADWELLGVAPLRTTGFVPTLNSDQMFRLEKV
jgi:hypothetical protein